MEYSVKEAVAKRGGKAEQRSLSKNLRNDPSNRKQKPNNAPISRRIPAHDPAKRDDGDGLDVPDHRTAHSAGFIDDVELGQIDHARAQPALQAR